MYANSYRMRKATAPTTNFKPVGLRFAHHLQLRRTLYVNDIPGWRLECSLVLLDVLQRGIHFRALVQSSRRSAQAAIGRLKGVEDRS